MLGFGHVERLLHVDLDALVHLHAPLVLSESPVLLGHGNCPLALKCSLLVLPRKHLCLPLLAPLRLSHVSLALLHESVLFEV